MRNCEFTLDGDTLTITVDLTEEHGLSSSGKSLIIGSTGGNQVVPGTDGVVVGLNVYRKA